MPEPIAIPVELDLDRRKLRRLHTLLGQIALAIDAYLEEEKDGEDEN